MCRAPGLIQSLRLGRRCAIASSIVMSCNTALIPARIKRKIARRSRSRRSCAARPSRRRHCPGPGGRPHGAGSRHGSCDSFGSRLFLCAVSAALFRDPTFPIPTTLLTWRAARPKFLSRPIVTPSLRTHLSADMTGAESGRVGPPTPRSLRNDLRSDAPDFVAQHDRGDPRQPD